DHRRLRDLCSRADVLLQPEWIVDEAMARQWRPGLIVVSVTPYGTTGPRSGVRASDLEVTAAGGSLSLAGEPDRAPLRTTLPQSPFWTGMQAAMGALFAVRARPRVGGQQVDVSGQASMVTVHPPASVHWDVGHEEHQRLGA